MACCINPKTSKDELETENPNTAQSEPGTHDSDNPQDHLRGLQGETANITKVQGQTMDSLQMASANLRRLQEKLGRQNEQLSSSDKPQLASNLQALQEKTSSLAQLAGGNPNHTKHHKHHKHHGAKIDETLEENQSENHSIKNHHGKHHHGQYQPWKSTDGKSINDSDASAPQTPDSHKGHHHHHHHHHHKSSNASETPTPQSPQSPDSYKGHHHHHHHHHKSSNASETPTPQSPQSPGTPHHKGHHHHHQSPHHSTPSTPQSPQSPNSPHHDKHHHQHHHHELFAEHNPNHVKFDSTVKVRKELK